MSQFQATQSYRAQGGLPGGLQRLRDETVELVKALLSPNTLIRQVEEMRALQVEAGRIEATHPVRAAALRRRAARLGL
jgi:hypothetical protein